MSVDSPINIYQEKLSLLSQGMPLWEPSPHKPVYGQVSIGDVGYVSEGAFIRMFNVILPWDDESNRKLGEPAPYEPLNSDKRDISRTTFGTTDYCSYSVTRDENTNIELAASPDP